VTRPPVDGGWLVSELQVLERLVADGDAVGLVAELARVVREPRRVAAGRRAPTAPA
jgi:hypothetical protein